MVGYNENASKQLSDSEYAIAGAAAGGLTRAVCQPLDVVKIRFQILLSSVLFFASFIQLQVEPLKQLPNVKYWSVSQALRTIVREEGIQALWKGHTPAQVLSVLYGLAQATCFEILTRELWHLTPDWHDSQYQPIAHFACGGVAGVLASAISFPFDLVRTRLVAQGEPKIYLSTSHALQEIFRKEGTKGLFRGIAPVLIQMAPYTGMQFSTYTFLTKLLSSNEDGYTKIHHSLAVGAVAGAIAKTTVYPLDLAKKRLQVIGFENGRLGFGQNFSTSGLLHCIQKTVKTEGVLALYKGLWPSQIKAGIVSALYFTVYENTCTLLLKYRHSL